MREPAHHRRRREAIKNLQDYRISDHNPPDERVRETRKPNAEEIFSFVPPIDRAVAPYQRGEFSRGLR